MDHICLSIIKKLNLNIISFSKHLKCKDDKGNIYIFSRNYLRQMYANPTKFCQARDKTTYLKNRSIKELQERRCNPCKIPK